MGLHAEWKNNVILGKTDYQLRPPFYPRMPWMIQGLGKRGIKAAPGGGFQNELLPQVPAKKILLKRTTKWISNENKCDSWRIHFHWHSFWNKWKMGPIWFIFPFILKLIHVPSFHNCSLACPSLKCLCCLLLLKPEMVPLPAFTGVAFCICTHGRIAKMQCHAIPQGGIFTAKWRDGNSRQSCDRWSWCHLSLEVPWPSIIWLGVYVPEVGPVR